MEDLAKRSQLLFYEGSPLQRHRSMQPRAEGLRSRAKRDQEKPVFCSFALPATPISFSPHADISQNLSYFIKGATPGSSNDDLHTRYSFRELPYTKKSPS